MGKRSNFERHERDYYPTPYHATEPLTAYLQPCSFVEPCAGDFRLAEHLINQGFSCTWACDIEPMHDNVKEQDAFSLMNKPNLTIITNPPWDRKILHPMIDHFKSVSPSTWLLFDADWMHTKQSHAYMPYCKTIISIGRVKWFDDKAGKDNAVWYEFVPNETTTTFIGRKD